MRISKFLLLLLLARKWSKARKKPYYMLLLHDDEQKKNVICKVACWPSKRTENESNMNNNKELEKIYLRNVIL